MTFSIKKILVIFALFMVIQPIQAQKKVKTKRVKVELKINASADKVWEAMVLDYGKISNFSPYIYSSNYENGSLKGVVGAERKCNFNESGTQWVHERIKSIDEANRIMYNTPIDGAKLPLDFENSYAIYSVTDNGDGTCTAGYEFIFRTKPAMMAIIAKGGFKKQLAGTLIGLKHYVETGEKVTPMNEKYKEIKKIYKKEVVID